MILYNNSWVPFSNATNFLNLKVKVLNFNVPNRYVLQTLLTVLYWAECFKIYILLSRARTVYIASFCIENFSRKLLVLFSAWFFIFHIGGSLSNAQIKFHMQNLTLDSLYRRNIHNFHKSYILYCLYHTVQNKSAMYCKVVWKRYCNWRDRSLRC
jgi:hypothetical protein